MNYMIKVGSQNGDLGVTFKLDDGVFNAGTVSFSRCTVSPETGMLNFLVTCLLKN